jgi:hypothetical protein
MTTCGTAVCCLDTVTYEFIFHNLDVILCAVAAMKVHKGMYEK